MLCGDVKIHLEHWEGDGVGIGFLVVVSCKKAGGDVGDDCQCGDQGENPKGTYRRCNKGKLMCERSFGNLKNRGDLGRAD